MILFCFSGTRSRAPRASKGKEHFTTLNAAIDAMRRGKFPLPIMLFCSPEELYRARTAHEDDINVLANSFVSFSSLHENSVVVLFWPDDEALPEHGFDVMQYIIETKRDELDGFFVVVGDHTQLAVKRLHADYPRNPLWRTLVAEVLICHRSRENYAVLKSWGVLDNMKGQRRALVSFEQKVLSLHEDFVNLTLEVDNKTKAYTSALAAVKAARRLEYGLNTNSFGQLWALATKTGAVWDLLERIFRGDVANATKFKKPKSAGNFVLMGNIPDEDLEVLLGRVVRGSCSLKQFTADCRLYKASARVQREILEQLDEDSWEEAEKRFAFSCAESFVQMWAAQVVANRLPNKTPLPVNFFEMLQAKIEQDKYVEDATARTREVSAHSTH